MAFKAKKPPIRAAKTANIKLASGEKFSHTQPVAIPPIEPPNPYDAIVYKDCPLVCALAGNHLLIRDIEAL